MSDTTILMNAAAIQRALMRIAHEIVERNEAGNEVVIVGIQKGGAPLAEKLAAISRRSGRNPSRAASWM